MRRNTSPPARNLKVKVKIMLNKYTKIKIIIVH